MKKLLLILMALFLWAGSSWAQAIIGTGTSTSNGSAADPVERYYNYEHFQIVYLASELTAAGMPSGATINSLGFSISESAVSLANYEIMMDHTTQALANPYIATTGMTVVRSAFTYTPVVQTAGNFDMITFTTNFTWDGTRNIVVNICTGSNPFTTPYGGLRYTAATSGAMRGIRTDGSSNCATATSTNYAYRPNIRFDYTSSSPSLSAIPSTINFGYVANGAYGYSQYLLSGVNLTGYPGNIAVTPSTTDFQVSNDNINWFATINVPYASATLTNYPVYVRFSPTGPPAYYSTTITNVGGGASANVAVSGTSYLFQLYCTSYATTTADEDIFNVSVGSLNNSSTCSTTGDFGSVINQYSNYTLSVSPPDLDQTGTINFSLSSGTCGGNYGNAFKIFIDYNIDGDFADTGEEVYVSAASTTGPHTETGSFVVPGGASLGNTMMRVICVETSTPSGIAACGTYSWGETEDYLVNIVPPAGCPAPYSLTVTNITSNGADLGWSGIESFFDVYVDLGGGAPGPSTTPTIDNTSNNPVTWAGGVPSNSYNWWVRSDCDPGNNNTDVSTWSGPNNFTTLCIAINSFPWTEDFENGGAIPICWSKEYVSGTTDWIYATGGYSSQPATAHSGTYNGRFYYASSGADITTKLITPSLDLSGVSNPYVIFYHTQASWAGDQDELYVYYKTSSGGTWTLLQSWTGNITVWTIEALALPNKSSDYYIAFEGHGNYGYGVCLDDVTVQDGAPVIPGLWTGDVDTDWFTGGNWDDGIVPIATTDVTIPAGCLNYPSISTPGGVCNSMNIQTGGSFYMIDSFFDVFTEVSCDGILDISGGTLNIGEYLYVPNATSIVTMSGGTLNTDGIFQNAAYTWSPGLFTLSGGTINQVGTSFFYGGTGSTMSGSFVYNVGGTIQLDNAMWTMTGGTINLLGTETTPNYFLPPTGTGTAVAYNLNINSGANSYVFARDANISFVTVANNFSIQSGAVNLASSLGTGYPGTFTVGGNFDIAANNTANLSIPTGTTFTVTGSANQSLNSPGDYGSIIGNVNGLYNLNVSFPGLGAGRWVLISPPVAGLTASWFNCQYLMRHDPITNTWIDCIPTDPLIPGVDYALWIHPNTLTDVPPCATILPLTGFTWTGAMINAPITTPLLSDDPIDEGWNNVGNPYTATIDWDAVGWTKTNVNNAIYFENSGIWGTYIAGVGANGGSKYIAPGQGFFVQCNNVAGGSLGFSPATRTHTRGTFLKNSVANMIRLQASGNSLNMETVIRFTEDATNGFDANYDAHMLFSDLINYPNVPQIYSMDNGYLAVNALSAADQVAVGFKAGVDGVYTIDMIENNDIPIVILEDLLTGNITDLNTSSYTFNYTAGENEARFVVHFVPLGISDNFASYVNVYTEDKEVVITVPMDTKGQVIVYNMMGQQVASSAINDVQTRIRLENSANYVVEVISSENVATKKVFVK